MSSATVAQESGLDTGPSVVTDDRSHSGEIDRGDETTAPSLVEGMLEKLDQSHDQWSASLEQSARRIDAFFADDRAFEDANETHGQITSDLVKVEGEDPKFDVRLRAKVRLPRTENSMRLLIESDAEELGEEQTLDSSLLRAAEETKLSLALETFLNGFDSWQVSPALGIKADWPPDPYARLRVTRYFHLEPWLARFSSNFSWYAVAGPIARMSLDFDRQLRPTLLFRLSSALKWEKDEDEGENTEASLGASVYQKLSELRAVSYSGGANFDSDEGWAVHSYGLGVAYRQALYKKWLFGEASPSVSFERQFDWDDTWSLTLRLEALLGRRYR